MVAMTAFPSSASLSLSLSLFPVFFGRCSFTAANFPANAAARGKLRKRDNYGKSLRITLDYGYTADAMWKGLKVIFGGGGRRRKETLTVSAALRKLLRACGIMAEEVGDSPPPAKRRCSETRETSQTLADSRGEGDCDPTKDLPTGSPGSPTEAIVPVQ